MTASSTVTIEVRLPPQQAEAAVYEAFNRAGLRDVSGGGGAMRGTAATSWLSWGETVTATIGHGPQGAVVQLHSASTLVTTLVDWGKNKKNVEGVLARLRELAPVV
ncbi:hypothetical protein ICW40_08645 [Actinotalea ferrariae]|uniref:hypothetical protein n=1 Tax=Actinotalea ferrariae TaxID=1386098 RepID=UPI001C8C222A|nr:hypothetical protein [Actinotalea ferrariae]MBX9244878.1 hypothetical protein [Actinotalea ferrariae]